MTERPRAIKRVFVSSTCYDLLDVRADLAEDLTSMGLDPVLSDVDNGNFEFTVKDSITTCLINVASADALVCIVSQRYGPPLGRYGFDDVSATHLEYRKAREAGLPIHFFARDRTLSEFDIFGRNLSAQESDGACPRWVTDRAVFDFIAEHKKLKGGERSNWIHTFRTSVDLRRSIRAILGDSARRERTLQLMKSGEVPSIHIVVAEGRPIDGTTASFDLSLRCTFGHCIAAQILTPNIFIGDISGELKGVPARLPYHRKTGRPAPEDFAIEYMTPYGHHVVDRFAFELSGGRIESRILERGVSSESKLSIF